jgi:hypothetical protein
MNQPNQPQTSNQQPETNDQPVNVGRRRLSKAALATSVVASLAARPALACSISGFMSGNASPNSQDPRCEGFGCTLGFWGQNLRAWRNTPYEPGKCKTRVGGTCTVWEIEGTKLSAILPANCTTPFESMKNLFLIQILNSGGGGVTVQCKQYIAAILNAAASSISYGSTVQDIQNGLCKAVSNELTPALSDKGVNYYTTVLLDGLNNRGCMFDSFGRCNTSDGVVFVLNEEGKCIPACPTGTAWDPVTMTCK